MAARTRNPIRHLRWGMTALMCAGIGYIALAGYALELGAVHHDLFCPEHGAYA